MSGHFNPKETEPSSYSLVQNIVHYSTKTSIALNLFRKTRHTKLCNTPFLVEDSLVAEEMYLKNSVKFV